MMESTLCIELIGTDIYNINEYNDDTHAIIHRGLAVWSLNFSLSFSFSEYLL